MHMDVRNIYINEVTSSQFITYIFIFSSSTVHLLFTSIPLLLHSVILQFILSYSFSIHLLLLFFFFFFFFFFVFVFFFFFFFFFSPSSPSTVLVCLLIYNITFSFFFTTISTTTAKKTTTVYQIFDRSKLNRSIQDVCPLDVWSMCGR